MNEIKNEKLQALLKKLSHNDHFTRMYQIFFDKHPGKYLNDKSFISYKSEFIEICLDYRQDAIMFSLPAMYMFCVYYNKIPLILPYLAKGTTFQECLILFTVSDGPG